MAEWRKPTLKSRFGFDRSNCTWGSALDHLGIRLLLWDNCSVKCHPVAWSDNQS
jgi:hypothetical protein